MPFLPLYVLEFANRLSLCFYKHDYNIFSLGTIYLACNNHWGIIFPQTEKEKRINPKSLVFSSATEWFIRSLNFNVNNLGRLQKKRSVTNPKRKEDFLEKGSPGAHSRIKY